MKAMNHYLEEFTNKLITPLFEDIRRTLEVTCNKSGANNHGSNFIGMLSVLVGIETIAQFINPKTQEELKNFTDSVLAEKEKGYNSEVFQPRHEPSDATASKLAKRFIKNYFGAEFSKQEFDSPLYELIWKFRNTCAHSFYPFVDKDNKKRGAVDWLYASKGEKRGIQIEKIEKEFEIYKNSLYLVDNNFFRVCPQILFIYLKKAKDELLDNIIKDENTREVFIRNYRRLAHIYFFEYEDSSNHKFI